MKIFKILLRLALGICLAFFGSGIFYLWAVDGGGGGFNGAYAHFYEMPNHPAQLVLISQADFQGDQDFFVGVRASKNEKWRQLYHSSVELTDKPVWGFGSEAIWTHDGSIIALSHSPKFFCAAYDFRFSKIYQATSNTSQATSRQITYLLQDRGGFDPTGVSFSTSWHKISQWRWQDVNLKQLIYSWKN